MQSLRSAMGTTIRLALRALRQARMGRQLATPPDANETAWLDAHLS